MKSRNPRAPRSKRKWAGLGEDLRWQWPTGLLFPLLLTCISSPPGFDVRLIDSLKELYMGRCTKNLKLDFPPASLGKEKPSSEMVRRAVQVLTTACTWDRSKAQWAEPQTTGTGALSQKCCDKLWSDHLGWLFSVFHSLGSFNQILTLKCLQRNRKMCQFSRETPTDVK